MPAPIITLTTDFGEGSPYVAEMKGVILSLQSEARIIDISHSIPPQDIRQGALTLDQTTPRFPPEAIHVAVVDPGVGTRRKIVCACIDQRRYVAPDNGLLGLLARRRPPSLLIEVSNRAYWRESVSHTFHGRDIMAPVAAHLSRGVAPEELGQPLEKLTPLDWPAVIIEKDRLIGEICAIDAFGNLITNIERALLPLAGSPQAARVSCRGRTIVGLADTYADRVRGELTALLGSSDRLEIAVVGGSAQQTLGAGVGERVILAGGGGAG